MPKPVKLKDALTRMKHDGMPMRRRLFAYLASFVLILLAAVIMLMALLGVFSQTERRYAQRFNARLDEATGILSDDMDILCAYSSSLARALSSGFSATLASRGIQDGIPDNDGELLSGLQEDSYDTLYYYMCMADCSGAFYMLNATVNDAVGHESHSGMYLKFSNINKKYTVNNDCVMYRGASGVARSAGISLATSWELEYDAADFAILNDYLRSCPPDGSPRVTGALPLPGTWESVMLVCAPVCGEDGEVIGICGFELSALYFSLGHYTNAGENERTVCILAPEPDGGTPGGAMFARNYSGFTLMHENMLEYTEGKPFSSYICGDTPLIGVSGTIRLGDSGFNVIIAAPQADYSSELILERHIAFFIGLGVFLLSLAACLLISHRYVKPILRGLESVKARAQDVRVKIPEIDDLMDFLSRQGKLDDTPDKEPLVYDEERYALFAANIDTLTKAEKAVFNLYLEGFSANQIANRLFLSINTIKTHNRHIYMKLNVASRKELLIYARVMRERASAESAPDAAEERNTYDK